MGDGRPTTLFLRLGELVPLLAAASGDDDRGRLLELLELDTRAAAGFDRRFWEDRLADGRAWLLLDGLDEVAELEGKAGTDVAPWELGEEGRETRRRGRRLLGQLAVETIVARGVREVVVGRALEDDRDVLGVARDEVEPVAQPPG